MRLTENFVLREFRCRDGSDVPDDLLGNAQLLADNLQLLRDRLETPIRIISGYRSPSHNRRIKGARRSQHLVAKAADIIVSGLTPDQTYAILSELIRSGEIMQGGLGRYTKFIHYDVRGTRARWRGAGVKDLATEHVA